jgi:NTP pyrophosphatase (non-canonical NTP hydrolase)
MHKEGRDTVSDSDGGAGPGVTLRRAQAEVDASVLALGGYWEPLANLARLFEECGELARALNQAYGAKRLKAGERPAAAAEELGDCLYVLLVLANSLQIDADAALGAALEKVRRRAAPAEERHAAAERG